MSTKSFKLQSRKEYSKIKKVKCPAFKDFVVFNAKGFNHIFYKGSRSGRDRKDIVIRMKLLPLAVKVLKVATLWQEEDEYFGKQKGKRKQVRFWVFEAVLSDRRIKVIVRQIGKGNKHFWSVIPAWRKGRFGKRLNYKKSLKGL